MKRIKVREENCIKQIIKIKNDETIQERENQNEIMWEKMKKNDAI